ncbi:MAG: hypothetical protein FJ139_08155 [Deltaproteobacteria bacterium]|nr:hypothetical protein [Deltaproteobacteria bacterium]
MWQKVSGMVPRRTVINLLICLSAIVVIVVVGIIPNFISASSLDEKILSLQYELEEQKNLHPVYQILKARSQKKVGAVLPFPVRNKLSREEIKSLPASFRDAARKANMHLISISPDLGSLGGDYRFLSVDVVVTGDFYDVRKFLIGLGEIPYLERIEEMQVQPRHDSMEFKIKVWLAIA